MIECYGICSENCLAFQNGKCVLDAKIAECDNSFEVVIGKGKPMNCSKCEYLKESTSEEESMWAECGITKEQLNPFELCYSTGIGKLCPLTNLR